MGAPFLLAFLSESKRFLSNNFSEVDQLNPVVPK